MDDIINKVQTNTSSPYYETTSQNNQYKAPNNQQNQNNNNTGNQNNAIRESQFPEFEQAKHSPKGSEGDEDEFINVKQKQEHVRNTGSIPSHAPISNPFGNAKDASKNKSNNVSAITENEQFVDCIDPEQVESSRHESFHSANQFEYGANKFKKSINENVNLRLDHILR